MTIMINDDGDKAIVYDASFDYMEDIDDLYHILNKCKDAGINPEPTINTEEAIKDGYAVALFGLTDAVYGLRHELTAEQIQSLYMVMQPHMHELHEMLYDACYFYPVAGFLRFLADEMTAGREVESYICNQFCVSPFFYEDVHREIRAAYDHSEVLGNKLKELVLEEFRDSNLDENLGYIREAYEISENLGDRIYAASCDGADVRSMMRQLQKNQSPVQKPATKKMLKL